MEQTKMTMSYELITPELAANLLETNTNNRSISLGTVKAYMNDMLAGNWDETVGVAISIDENGMLRDGQHRLMAIAESGVPIHMWICRNVSPDGIYDNNRKRSTSDQITIMRSDFEGVYRSTRYISIARALITDGERLNRRTVTAKEVIGFTERNKTLLDEFFLNIDQSTVPKISLALVHLAMFTAYCADVSIEELISFYEVLKTGMSSNETEFPIIAYRNYLLTTGSYALTHTEVGRCQYAIKKYLTNSCAKRTVSPKELIYPFPKLKLKEG